MDVTLGEPTHTRCTVAPCGCVRVKDYALLRRRSRLEMVQAMWAYQHWSCKYVYIKIQGYQCKKVLLNRCGQFSSSVCGRIFLGFIIALHYCSRFLVVMKFSNGHLHVWSYASSG